MKRPRLPSVVLALSPIALMGCSAGDKAASETSQGKAGGNVVLAKLDLASDAFRNGQPIPAQYTCDGADRSPALRWNEPPAGTKSLVLIVDDPGSPGGLFGHWGAYNLPPSSRWLAGAQVPREQAMNDFGKVGYGGPCPPPGDPPHQYHFKLLALDTDRLSIPAGAKINEVRNAARSHTIAEGELVGTYERK